MERGIILTELDWFMSLLTKPDLIKIRRKTNIRISGFDRNPDHAPVHKLREEIKNCIRRGYEKRNRKKIVIKLHDILKDIASDLKKDFPHLIQLNLEQFIIKIDLETRLRPFEKVAIFYDLFEADYRENLELLIENTRNKRDFYQGLIADLTLTSKDKLETILNIYSPEIIFNEITKQFSEILMPEKDKELADKLKTMDEVDFPIFLTSLSDFEQCLAIYYFLKEKDRYRHGDYQKLMLYLKFKLQENNFHIIKNELKDKVKEVEQIYEEKRKLEELNNHFKQKLKELDKIEELESEKEILYKKNKNILHEQLMLQKELDRLKIQSEQDQSTLAQIQQILNEISKLFNEIAPKGRDCLIITNASDLLLETLYKNKIQSPAYLTTLVKSNHIENLRHKTIFLYRSAYPHTPSWFDITQFLRRNNFDFVELTGFDTAENLLQILQYFLREEIALYHD